MQRVRNAQCPCCDSRESEMIQQMLFECKAPVNFERGPIMMTNFNVLFLMIYFVLEDIPPLICPYICFLGTR